MLLILFAVMLVSTTHVQARDLKAGPHYRSMVRQLMTFIPEDFNYSMFRLQYSRSDYYRPDASALIQDLMQQAYIVDEGAESEEERETALKTYHSILSQHLANYGVLKQAIVFSYQDPRFGNYKTLQAILDGMLESIERSGNGETLNGAYDVITMEEETALLVTLGKKVISTEARSSGISHYNMHLVEETAEGMQGQTSTIFVDTRIPVAYLLAQKEEHDKNKPSQNLLFKGR